MKQNFTLLLLALVLFSCSSVKRFEVGDQVSGNTYSKLMREYLKDPHDRNLASKLQYAYTELESQQLVQIESLKRSSNAYDLERLLNAYTSLQSLYDGASAHNAVGRLLKPGNVREQMEDARQQAADLMYEEAKTLLEQDYWKSSREAYDMLCRVNNWYHNYKDISSLMNDARQRSMAEVVIQPLRAEGFYYSNNYNNNSFRFADMLIRDLSGYSGGYNNGYGSNNSRYGSNNRRYEVYADNGRFSQQHPPDIVVEPVWTRWTMDPVRYNESQRTVSKDVEIGKDSANKPIYKKLSATLYTREEYCKAEGYLELRMSDVKANQPMSRRGWNESYTWRRQKVTYKGDAGALSNSDWELINQPQTRRPDENWMQERVLEKIYQQSLNYLQNMLR